MIHSSSFPPKPMDVLQGTSRYPQPLSAGAATQTSLHQRGLTEPSFLKRSEPGGSVPSITISIPKPSFVPSLASASADKTSAINHITVQARQNSPMAKPSSSDRSTGTSSWKPTFEPPPAPSAKRRRRSSPGPVIVIKDEPEDEDEVRFVQSSVGSSLPDSSTGAQSKPRQQQKVSAPVPAPGSESKEQRPQPAVQPESEKERSRRKILMRTGALSVRTGGSCSVATSAPKFFIWPATFPL